MPPCYSFILISLEEAAMNFPSDGPHSLVRVTKFERYDGNLYAWFVVL